MAVGSGPGGEEEPDRRKVVHIDSMVKGGYAGFRHEVDVCAGRDQALGYFDVLYPLDESLAQVVDVRKGSGWGRMDGSEDSDNVHVSVAGCMI
jgi:hypothetical protein